MFRVGILTDKKRIEARTLTTREEVDDWILSFDKDEQLIKFRIECDGKLIETERGKI